jgi:hypothetical protein
MGAKIGIGKAYKPMARITAGKCQRELIEASVGESLAVTVE